MSIISIGKLNFTSNGRFSSNYISDMNKDEALLQLKNKGFINWRGKIIFLHELVLYSAIKSKKTFKVLFEEGLVPKFIPNENNCTLLMLACRGLKYKNVKLLLERGDAVNALSGYNSNALQYIGKKDTITNFNLISICRLLFSYGINLKNQRVYGNTILHTISSSEIEVSEFIKEILLEAFFQGKEYLKEFIEMKNEKGDTALILAAKNMNFIAVKEFLRFGANRFTIDKKGKTFLDYLSPLNKGLFENYIETFEIRDRMYKKGIPRG